jgi:hypothetical protein
MRINEFVKQRLDPKCWTGKHKEGTKIKGGVRVNNCVPNESVEEAANAAQQAAIAIAKKKKPSVDEGSLADMRAHFDKNDPVADRPKHEINNKMPATIIAILQKINKNKSVSKEEYLKLLAYKKSQAVAEGTLNEFAPGAGDEGGGEDPYRYPKLEHYARSVDYFSQFEADHFDREDFDDDTGVFKGYWGSTQIAYFKFDNPARTGGDDPGMGWYYEPESAGKGADTGAAPAVDNADERKQQELSMIDAFLKSGNRPNPDSQIGRLMKKHGLAEAAHTTNFNDDDWYEINPDTETIVSQRGPQAYRLPFGQRQIKLPNGNIVVRGMRAKHMRLNTGLGQSTKQ